MPFRQLQGGTATAGSGGTVNAPLAAASRAGTHLIASLLSPAGTTPFTTTATGWKLAGAASTATLRAELWYYAANPGGVLSVPFTSGTGVPRGALAEYSSAPGTTMAPDGTVGAAAGPGPETIFPVSSGATISNGDLSVALFGDVFSAAPAGSSWTDPAGWTVTNKTSAGVLIPWASYYIAGVAAGMQSVTGVFSTQAGQTGWAALIANFTEVPALTFLPMLINGGEYLTKATVDPVTGRVVVGGDVEGIFGSDDGISFTPSQAGMYPGESRNIADIQWSALEPGTVYACAGKQGGGGFLTSGDGGHNWNAYRDGGALQFWSNGGPSPVPSGQNTGRTTGTLLVQCPASRTLFAGQGKGPVMRSSNLGTTWQNAGLGPGSGGTGSQWYIRSLAGNPANEAELWAACWDWDTANRGRWGGVWHCTNAQAATGTQVWAQDAHSPGSYVGATVEDLFVLGGYLYAACGADGLFRKPVGSTTAWESLNGTFIDTSGSSYWTCITGVIPSGSTSHVIYAAAGPAIKLAGAGAHKSVIKITITTGGVKNWSDLASNARINVDTIPPDFRTHWQGTQGGTFQNYFGGASYKVPYLTVDPTDPTGNTIYATGSGGIFKTTNGGSGAVSPAFDWQIIVNGIPLFVPRMAAFCPGDPKLLTIGASDYSNIDLYDGLGYDNSQITQLAIPGSNIECHALAYTQDGTALWACGNLKYGSNSGGTVQWRPKKTNNWNDTLWPKTNAPVGIYTDTDSGGLFVCVAATGAGIWRWQGGAWSQRDTTAGKSGVSPIPAAHLPGSQYAWFYDSGVGLYLTTDYGLSWSMTYPLTTSNSGAGFLAVNPVKPHEVWVTDGKKIVKLTSAHTTSPVAVNITAVPAPGGIAIDASGVVYVVALPGAAGPTQLWRSSDGGTSWAVASDSSIGELASQPGFLAISNTGVLYLATDSNVMMYGTPVRLLSDAAAATDRLSVSRPLGQVQYTEAAGAADVLHVTASTPGASPVLPDLAGAGEQLAVTSVIAKTPVTDLSGAADHLDVAKPPAVAWALPAAAGGATTTIVSTGPAVSAAGVAAGQKFTLYQVPVPYLLGTNAVASGTTTCVITLTAPLAAGDSIYVGAASGASAGSQTVTGVSDSQGNAYSQQASDTSLLNTFAWAATGAGNPGGVKALAAGAAITVTYSGTGGSKAAVAAGVPGLASSPLDVTAHVHGSGKAPSVTTPPTGQQFQIGLAVLGTASAGGTPAWATGWNALGSAQQGTGAWCSMAYAVLAVKGAGAIAQAATGNTNWALCVLALNLLNGPSPLQAQPFTVTGT